MASSVGLSSFRIPLASLRSSVGAAMTPGYAARGPGERPVGGGARTRFSEIAGGAAAPRHRRPVPGRPPSHGILRGRLGGVLARLGDSALRSGKVRPERVCGGGAIRGRIPACRYVDRPGETQTLWYGHMRHRHWESILVDPAITHRGKPAVGSRRSEAFPHTRRLLRERWHSLCPYRPLAPQPSILVNDGSGSRHPWEPFQCHRLSRPLRLWSFCPDQVGLAPVRVPIAHSGAALAGHLPAGFRRQAQHLSLFEASISVHLSGVIVAAPISLRCSQLWA